MSWIYYLLEANLYLILFFAFYYLLLRRETWYQYNRAYLLITSVLAFIIPLVQLGILKPSPVVPAGQLRITDVAFNYADVTIDAPAPTWTREDLYLAAYLLIVCCLLVNLGVKIYKLVRLSQITTHKSTDKWKIIETDSSKGAFSFFSYLFVSPEMALSDIVIAHELVHIRQKHSWDIVYFEILKVINWFNPIAYLLQHSIKELHEFIADGEIAGAENKIDQYTDFLLKNAYGIHENQLANNLFNKSLLKKRIMMLHQKRSGNSARLKYLLVLPLSVGLLCASTLAFAKSYGWIDIAPKHKSPDKTFITTEPGKTKLLKITQGGITVITGKLSVHEKTGKINTYTANTFTDRDKAYLLEKKKIQVEIFETEHPETYSQIGGMDVYRAGSKVNSDTKNTTGDIPVLSKGATGFMIDPNNYSFKTLTDMSLKFHNKGYKMDFDDYKDDSGNPILKISLRKSDSKPNTGTSATFRIDELKKMGHVIFVGADPAKNLVHVVSHKFVLLKHDTSQVIRKKTDSIIHKKADVIIDQKINSTINKEIKKATASPGNQQSLNKLPPPEGYNPGFSTLYTYLEKHIRYPTKYFEQKTVDNVIVEFTTGADYKVSGVKIKNNAMPFFADEVTRQLQAYTDTVNRAPGTYFFLVQFNLINEKHTRTWLPSNEYLDLTGKPDCAGNIEIVGYVKE